MGILLNIDRFVIILLMVSSIGFSALAQQDYNSCFSALELCPGVTETVDNIDANISFCGGCEDDFVTCFPLDNTIWMTFTTNATGGNVQVNLSNLNFQTDPGQDNAIQATIVQVGTPCSSAGYTEVFGSCAANINGNWVIPAGILPGNTTYYIILDGDNTGLGITSPAECTFDITLGGAGVTRPMPTISITPASTSICLNDVLTLNANTTNCPSMGDFSWYINDVLIAVTSDSLFSTSAVQDGDIVRVETSCYSQCAEIVTDSTTPISVYSFFIEAGGDQSTAANIATTLNGQTSAPVYSWEPSFLFSDPTSLNTIITTDETVTITLTAVENGCTLSDQLTITVEEGLEIPNTFSPNGDGINETWVITGIEKYPESLVKIFTRWGQEVYQVSGYDLEKSWEGTINSRKAAEGVYFYIINLNDDSPLLKGSLTLIR